MIQHDGDLISYTLRGLNFYPQAASWAMAYFFGETAVSMLAKEPYHAINYYAYGSRNEKDWEISAVASLPDDVKIPSPSVKNFNEIDAIQQLKLIYDEHAIVSKACGMKPVPQEDNLISGFSKAISDYKYHGGTPFVIASERLILPALREEKVLADIDIMEFFNGVPTHPEVITNGIGGRREQKKINMLENLNFVTQIVGFHSTAHPDSYTIYSITPFGMGLELVDFVDSYDLAYKTVDALSQAYIENAGDAARPPQAMTQHYRHWRHPGTSMTAVPRSGYLPDHPAFAHMPYAN